MIVRDMIKRIHGQIADYSRTYWNDERIIVLINDIKDSVAQELVCDRCECYYELPLIADQQKYEVPHNLTYSHYLYLNSTYNRKIKIKVGPASLYGPTSVPTQTGTPEFGFIWKYSGRREVTFFPVPNEDLTADWYFLGWPEDIANDNDEVNFPIDWHPSIVRMCLNRIKREDEVISVADELLLETKEMRRIKRLDSTKAILEEGGTYGTLFDSIPQVGSMSEMKFRIDRGDGAIW